MKEMFLQYFAQLQQFWQQYGFWIALASAGLLLLVIVCNLLRNDYRSVNRKLMRSRAMMPKLLQQGNRQRFESTIPQPYLAQYRCYRRTENLKANEVISFVPVKSKVVGIWLMVLTMLVVALDTTILALHNVYFTQYWLAASTIVVLVGGIFAIKAVKKYQLRKAQRVLNSYLDVLTAVYGKSEGEVVQPMVDEEKVDNAVKSIEVIGKSEDKTTALDKVKEVLRDNALNGERTVRQQRKINRALNGLMLSIAKRHAEARKQAQTVNA